MLRSSSSRPWSNLLGLERLALRLFRSLPFVLLPNDKGPGFSFMDVATFAAVEQSVSSNASYIGIHRCDIPVESTMRACAAAARRVEAYLGLDGAAAQINRSLTRGTLFARLGLTVKSHKEPGSMTCRNLHKMPSYQLEGLAKWVGAQLASKLNVPHIMTDSFAVKRSLHGMQVPAGAVLATLDLKDFFMSGPIFDLIADCVSFFDGPLGILIGEVLCLLLDNQYIVLSDGVQFFKCVAGSGMGLPHSGMVANLSFLKRVEVALVTPECLTRHSILRYVRYFDDILCVYHDRSMFAQFVQDMKVRATHFTITCSAVSSIAVQYLDLEVAARNCLLTVFPTVGKPTIPLACSSGHVPHVHNSWPAAVASRFFTLADHSNHSAKQLLTYYEKYNADPGVICTISKYASSPHALHVANRAQLDESTPTSWLRLGSHPLWWPSMPRMLNSVPQPVGFECHIRIAWKNMYPNLAQKVELHNRRALTEGGRKG